MVCKQIIKSNKWWLLEDAERDGVAEVSVGRTVETCERWLDFVGRW